MHYYPINIKMVSIMFLLTFHYDEADEQYIYGMKYCKVF